MGIGFGSQDIGDDLRPAACHQRFAHRRQHPGRVGIGAVAENDVEDDRRHLRVGAMFAHHLDARLRVDHRMRPTLGVLLLAEIEALV